MMVFSPELVCYAERERDRDTEREREKEREKESEFRERNELGCDSSPFAERCSENRIPA